MPRPAAKREKAARKALRCWGIEGAKLIWPLSCEQEHFLQAHRNVLWR